MKTKKEIIKLAREAAENAYAKYSNYRVGAAIELKDGTIIQGCNVENAVYGLTLCAERTAMFNMISKGFKKDDVVSFGLYVGSKTLGTPCGSCRQVMVELIPMDTIIHMGCDSDETMSKTVSELLPFTWSEESLDV